MKAEEQVARMLRMVPYLSAHQGVAVTEVARVFGTTPTQVIRDLEVLQFCGLPGGYYDDLFDVDIDGVREDGHVFFRNAEVLARPLRLRPAEAAGLLAALRLVVEVAADSAAARSALDKLEAAVGSEARGVSVAVAATDPGRRASVAAAIADRRAVRLTYRTPGRPGFSDAVVEPARLRIVDGYTYVDAWSRPRGAWRSFRLDRVEGVERLDDPVEERGEPPEGWFGDVASQLTLTLVPSARWVAEYYPTSAVEDLGDRVRVRFPVASTKWAVGLLLRLGGQVLEVSDDGALDAARLEAAAALALYGAGSGSIDA
jgi:proteasome accessory factor C